MFRESNNDISPGPTSSKPKTSAEIQATFLRSLAAQRPATMQPRQAPNNAFASSSTAILPDLSSHFNQNPIDTMGWFGDAGNGQQNDFWQGLGGDARASQIDGHSMDMGQQTTNSNLPELGNQGWDQVSFVFTAEYRGFWLTRLSCSLCGWTYLRTSCPMLQTWDET